ncbi:MAG: VWA domain-containing protein [Phycisphaerae bacterium]|nr:VWA domain-containing protein [Phycisphaerae bacterium]
MSTSRRERFRLLVVSAALAMAAALMGPAAARADGFIIIKPLPGIIPPMPPRPRPPRMIYMPLSIKHHRVTVEITNAAAVTKVDQVFHNPNPRQLEGTYIFPLPDDVAVQRFTMFMNGKEVSGELLDKDKARQIYEDYVRKMKDPALLEYVGTRMFKARVFPIPPNGDVRITMDYSQAIPVQGGQGTYRYPLNTEKFSSKPLEEVSVVATIRSDVPLSSVFCPTHPARIDRKGPKEYVVSYEGKSVLPDKDFLLYYNLSDKEFGLSLLTHKDGSEDGFFMARLAPKMPDSEKVIPKDICFVIDVSGSMSGEKMAQAQKSLKFCLANLNKDDRFNVVSFSTESRAFRPKLTPADAEDVSAARKHVDELKAIGGTNINEALLDALKMRTEDGKRPYLVVFMTDGEPTVGVTDAKEILQNVRAANQQNVRIFVLGVGTKVNTHLLDRLAEENHGNRDYVTEQEDLEIKLSNFYTSLANPVLSDVGLTFNGISVHDVYPKKLPDLFKGSELVVFGRYGGHGKATIRLTGTRSETKMLFGFETELPASQTGNDFVPRLWARTKIGYLMDQIRLHGSNEELKQEVVRLSKQYGIMTELTSWLVLEDTTARPASTPAVLREALNRPGRAGGMAKAGRGFAAQRGAESVDVSQRILRMKSAGQAAAAPARRFPGGRWAADEDESRLRDGSGRQVLRTVGAKTFYREGETWVDSVYATAGERKPGTVKIALYSDEYFALARKHPDLGKYLAIGARVIVMLDGKGYETVEP